MPFITLSNPALSPEVEHFSDQLKCKAKGNNKFDMTDLARLDLYTEPGLLRQLGSLLGTRALNHPQPPYKAISGTGMSPGCLTISFADEEALNTVIPSDFLAAVRHYFRGEVTEVVRANSFSLNSPTSGLSSRFVRVLLSDLSDLAMLDQVHITASVEITRSIRERVKKVVVSYEEVTALLGTDVSLQDVKDALGSFGYRLEEPSDGRFLVHVPFHRVDIASSSDVIEDVMLYHLNRFKSNDLVHVNHPQSILCRRDQQQKREINDRLLSFEFKEIKTPVLRQSTASTDNRCATGRLRRDLLGSFLQFDASRQSVKFPHKVYEFGLVQKGDYLRENLGIGIGGNGIDFNYLFSIIHQLLGTIRGERIKLRRLQSDKYEEGSAFSICIGNDIVGEIGFVSDKYRNTLKVKTLFLFAEVDLDSIQAIKQTV